LLYLKFSAPGHFYSTIPSYSELLAREERLFSRQKQAIVGIDLCDRRMLDYLDRFAQFYSEFSFPETATDEYRFFLSNSCYSRGDAVVLYSMMRELKPNRIIEIGSGYSTCLVLDVMERYLEHSVDYVCVEPFPNRMLSMIRRGDRERFRLISEPVQEVDLELFSSLKPNDILFIDSTHVSKCNSDVNALFFRILPVLPGGVYVHFHDIFYPFEYPRKWLLEIGASWNELYVLRAFLQYNSEFSVEFFCDYMGLFHREKLSETVPVFLKGPGGSIWLRRRERESGDFASGGGG
jgi:predicted O-methyltransferase YrrM